MDKTRILIKEKDTLLTTCFCFDEFNFQIKNENFYNNNRIKYCKVFVRKKKKSILSYWDYRKFIKKDTVFKIFKDYFKTDSINCWVVKNYKNGSVISENKVEVTDSIALSTESHFTSQVNGSFKVIITKRQYIKTRNLD